MAMRHVLDLKPLATTRSVVPTPGDVGDGAPGRPAFSVSRLTGPVSVWRHRGILLLIALQLTWSLAVPIRNVMLLSYPVFLDDGVSVEQQSYVGVDNTSTTEFLGRDILEILNQTFQITLDNAQVHQILTSTRAFTFDQLGSALSTKEHATISKFISMYAQATMFPPSQFVPRQELIYYPNIFNTSVIDNVTTVCRAEYRVMHGLRCTNEDGEACKIVDWERNRTHEFVNMSDLYAQAGVGARLNTFALNHLVVHFMQLVDSLYHVWDWSAFLQQLTTNDELKGYQLTGAAMDVLYVDDERTSMSEKLTATDQDGNKRIYSCWASELLLMDFYNTEFVVYLLQSELQKRPQLSARFNVSTSTKLYPIINDRIQLYDNISMYITSGVRVVSNKTSTALLGSTEMTRKEETTMAIKFTPTRLYGGATGNPERMIRYMSWYDGLYSNYVEGVLSPIEAECEMLLAGSYWSGFNTFKDDWWAMTNRHFVLRERPADDALKLMSKTMGDDEVIAKWFGDAQARSDISLRRVLASHFDASSETNTEDCHAALLFMIAQVTWLMAVTDSPILTQLVFYSMLPGGWQAAPFFLEKMLQMQVVGQTSLGQLRTFQYTDPSFDPNAAWPIVPVLSIFRDVYNATTAADMFLTQLNATFSTLADVKDGKINLQLQNSCPIGAIRYNIKSADSLQVVYTKLYPAFEQAIQDLMQVIPAIHNAMMDEISPTMFIRRQFLTGTRIYTKPIDVSEGPPAYIKQTALSIGLMKLSTRNVPKQQDVRKLLKYQHCYDVLELRYLNVTTRCMYEDGSFTELRRTKHSQALRTMMSVLWALAAVLNTFSAFVALRVTKRVWNVYYQTKLVDIDWLTALKIKVQGPSIVCLQEVLVMTASCIPMLISYHMPISSDFIDLTSNHHSPLGELLLALALTWFVRLGIGLAGLVCRIHFVNFWYWSICTAFHGVIVLVAVVIRQTLTTNVNDDDYSRGLRVLLITVLTVMLSAFLLATASKWFDRIPATHDSDALERAFARLGLNRMQHGVLAQSPSGWSVSGLLLEGWSVVEVKDKLVLMRDAHRYVLHVDVNSVVQEHQRPLQLRSSGCGRGSTVHPTGGTTTSSF